MKYNVGDVIRPKENINLHGTIVSIDDKQYHIKWTHLVKGTLWGTGWTIHALENTGSMILVSRIDNLPNELFEL